MKLGHSEKKFYEGVYSKLEQSGQILNELACIKLIERGVDDPEACKKIWGLASSNNTKQILGKKEMFKMLKIIAAYQQGYKLEELSLESLPELPKPNLPKKTEKAAANSENKEKESETTTSQNQKDATENNKIASKESAIISNNDTEISKKESTEDEDIKKAAKEERKTEEIEERKLGETNDKPVLEEKNTIEKRNKIVQDLESELTVPEKVEQVEIPNFNESIRIDNPNILVNPFKNKQESKKVTQDNRISSNNGKSEMGTNTDSELEVKSFVNNNKNKERKVIKPEFIGNMMQYTNYLDKVQRIKVEIVDTLTYTSGFMGYGTYVAYLIKCRFHNGEIFQIERRFSDFDWLNSYLHSQPQYKGYLFPKLPEKKSIGTTDPNFVSQRKQELEKYLKELGRHSIVSQDPVFRIFLGDEAKENLQSIKDKKPAVGLTAFTAIDLQKVKGAYEYMVASMKTKIRKEDLRFDWKDINERMSEVFNLDEVIAKTLKNLQKNEELYKGMQAIGSQLNILHTKIMNRVDDESYYEIGALSSIFVAKANQSYQESFAVEDLSREVRNFRGRIDGFKESYALLFSTLEEILTNKELNKSKQSKMLEYQAVDDGQNMALTRKVIGEIEQKIGTLEKEAGVIRDNLTFEINQLFEEFEPTYSDIFMPAVMGEFYSKKTSQFEKEVEFWVHTAAK